MKVETVKRMIRLQEWAKQINQYKQSGQKLQQWCEGQGISRKTYYYRLKRVQEEMLDALETQSKEHTLRIGGFELNAAASPRKCGKAVERSGTVGSEAPAFAVFTVPQNKGIAVTIQIGEYTVNVHNGANEITVEQALRTVSRL
jgi:hypothetical protein